MSNVAEFRQRLDDLRATAKRQAAALAPRYGQVPAGAADYFWHVDSTEHRGLFDGRFDGTFDGGFDGEFDGRFDSTEDRGLSWYTSGARAAAAASSRYHSVPESQELRDPPADHVPLNGPDVSWRQVVHFGFNVNG